MAMTPRARSAAVSEASLVRAPRSLNELVTWRFSYLTKTSAPVSADSRGAGSIGVRSTWPAMTRRAASMSAKWSIAQDLGSLRVNLDLIPTRPPWPVATRCLLQRGRFFAHFLRHCNGALRIMATSEPRRLGVSVELKPHAYDPATNPELFEGVLARRVVAFLIDFVILSIPVVFVSMFIFVVGIVTFGLGFLFYGLLWPGDGDLGDLLLRHDARRPGLRHHRHAGHGYRDAHLVRLAGLFRARRGPCRGVLGHGFGADAVRPAGLPVQRAPALPARHPGRHRRHQQCGARGVARSHRGGRRDEQSASRPFDAGGFAGDSIAHRGAPNCT